MISVAYSRHVFLFALLSVSPGAVLAEPSSGVLSLGYRVDSLDWNISGGSGGPNILSELEWKDMGILQLRGELSHSSDTGAYFRGQVGYGWVLDGVNQDSDYAGNNRTSEFSRSVNRADGSRVLDLSGGLGMTFYAGEVEQWRIIPMLGYSYHQQDLRMTHGNQVVWDADNAALLGFEGNGIPLGSFPGLNSSYNAEWHGPWLGADIFLDLQTSGTLFARLEAHWVNYFAQANWNLRRDFAQPVSFEHKADGQGRVLELGWQSVSSRTYWTWGVSIATQSWTTDSGFGQVFLSDGSIGVTRLNEVNRSSSSINLNLHKSFDR